MTEKNVNYFVKERFELGKSNRVYARDDDGKMTGEYDGYYNPRTGAVTLYPAKGSWIYGKLKKEQISVSIIKLSV
jgi:hypothetical protein